ncbi:TRAP transporter small permease [Blastochloris viridis]|uniref:TRAP transporter small permease protein n=1 Tax=Blastochloris viridis TaxID=1079 RepID=A0A0H5BNX6_BLAVI|nr:TRAP transporter small permease subunit [Blastochloris viridis]ALK08327.1 Sialic acid TRAP transporter permease protein SiaT [Blastochloris viridis]BAR98403.1 TRAP-type transport system [Blastochloris viridis]CUU44249.1 Neu5Ac permease [Blastochloris viridis]
MNAALRRVLTAADRLAIGGATALAVAALVVALGAGVWQVAARFLLEAPSPWSEALVRTALIWMTMLGLGAALRSGALLSIDLVGRLAPPPLKRALEAFALLSNLALMGVLVWFGWEMAERVRFQVLAGLDISIAWGYAAIPVGAGFAAVGAVARFLDPAPLDGEAQP